MDAIRREAGNMTDEDCEESEDEPSPESVAQEDMVPNHHAFLFGYMSANFDLRPLHPMPSQIPFIWQMYCENVDPIVKILHVPSMTELIRDVCRNNLDQLPPSTEALLFSIHFAVVASMDEEEVGRQLPVFSTVHDPVAVLPPQTVQTD